MTPYGPIDRFAQPVSNEDLSCFHEAAQRYGNRLTSGSMFDTRKDERVLKTSLVIKPTGEIISNYSKLFPFKPYEQNAISGAGADLHTVGPPRIPQKGDATGIATSNSRMALGYSENTANKQYIFVFRKGAQARTDST